MPKRIPAAGFESIAEAVFHLSLRGFSVAQIAAAVGRPAQTVRSARCTAGLGRSREQMAVLTASDRLRLARGSADRITVVQQIALCASAVEGLDRELHEARALLGELQLLQ